MKRDSVQRKVLLAINKRRHTPYGKVLLFTTKTPSSVVTHNEIDASPRAITLLILVLVILVLPVYGYQRLSVHPPACMLSHGTPQTAARQASLSMDFSRQEYWSGLPFPSLPAHINNNIKIIVAQQTTLKFCCLR